LPASTTNAILDQNEPSRESIFCDKVGNCWRKLHSQC